MDPSKNLPKTCGTVLPYVSVIIPTYHDWRRLELCVNALAIQEYPEERYEIIIVNNDPEDKELLSFIPSNCSVVTEQKRGSYAARNTGLRIAKGEIIAFTDSDCIPNVTWIKNAVDFFVNNHNVKRLGGGIQLFYKSEKLSFSEIYEKVFSFLQEDYVKNLGTAATANMFAYRNLFSEVGFFDDSLFSGSDMNWGIKAGRAGYSIAYCPNSVVRHPARNTLLEIIKKNKRAGGGSNDIYSSRIKLLSVLSGLLPPVLVGFKVLRRADLSFKEKIVSISLKYFVKVIISIERIKVLYFGKNPKNI